MNRKQTTRDLVLGALIAAAYVVLTYVSAALGLAYGAVQFRLSEVLCILPVFTPTAIYGLTVGCIISNMGSSLGMADMVFGAAATLLASSCTYMLRNVKVKAIPFFMPVLFNALIVGTEIAIFAGDIGFLAAAAGVALGEAVVVYGVGYPLYVLLKKTNILK